MSEFFFQAFVSLFVAIDAFGALPLFTSLTKGMRRDQRERLVLNAVVAAFAIGLIFVTGGEAIFRFLGITEDDFRIAGGLLLLIFAIRDLIVSHGHQGAPAPETVGIVPIAVPLIMGPAALATLLLGVKQYGSFITVSALVTNLALVWLLFRQAGWVLKKVGDQAADAVAKIFALLLAAIGVMLIRQGLKNILLGM